jgi:D-glycerate 3-kinase
MNVVDPAISSLLNETADAAIQRLKRPVRIGVSGSQGSGKSTLAEAFAKSRPRVAHFSLDDVYLTTKARQELAARVSPLFKTRGAPGTHDLALAEQTCARLKSARARDLTPIPSFDKLADAPRKPNDWPHFEGTPNVVLIEGWCLGATPEPEAALAEPRNALEADDDKTGAWRAYANAQLAGPYAAFFGRFDAIIHLAAPSWDVVPRWRLEQEARLRGVAVSDLDANVKARIDRFVLQYERITRHMLAGGVSADWIVRLDENRRAEDYEPSVR